MQVWRALCCLLLICLAGRFSARADDLGDRVLDVKRKWHDVRDRWRQASASVKVATIGAAGFGALLIGKEVVKDRTTRRYADAASSPFVAGGEEGVQPFDLDRQLQIQSAVTDLLARQTLGHKMSHMLAPSSDRWFETMSDKDTFVDTLTDLPRLYLFAKDAPFVRETVLHRSPFTFNVREVIQGFNRSDHRDGVRMEESTPLFKRQEEHVISQIQILYDGRFSRHLPRLRSVYRLAGNVPSWVIVMDQPGQTLADMCHEGEFTYNKKEVKRIFADLFRALAALHEMGVCHCGLSGYNVAMPTGANATVLMDFDNHLRWHLGKEPEPRSVCASSLAQMDALRDLYAAKRSPLVEEHDQPLCTTSDKWTLAHLMFNAMFQLPLGAKIMSDEHNQFYVLDPPQVESGPLQKVWQRAYDRLENMARQKTDTPRPTPTVLWSTGDAALYHKIFMDEATMPSAREIADLLLQTRKAQR